MEISWLNARAPSNMQNIVVTLETSKELMSWLRMLHPKTFQPCWSQGIHPMAQYSHWLWSYPESGQNSIEKRGLMLMMLVPDGWWDEWIQKDGRFQSHPCIALGLGAFLLPFDEWHDHYGTITNHKVRNVWNIRCLPTHRLAKLSATVVLSGIFGCISAPRWIIVGGSRGTSEVWRTHKIVFHQAIIAINCKVIGRN